MSAAVSGVIEMTTRRQVRANKQAHLSAEQRAAVAEIYQEWLDSDSMSMDEALEMVKKKKGFTVARATFASVGKQFGFPGKRDYQAGVLTLPMGSQRLRRVLSTADSTPLERVSSRLAEIENGLAELRTILESGMPTDDPVLMRALVSLYRLERG